MMKVNDDSYINNVERKIIENIVKGKTNREISANIGKAEATVRNYIYVLFQRFGCKNRTELAMLFLEKFEKK
jgi:DNA-binding NarL/FixJ family response regulator